MIVEGWCITCTSDQPSTPDRRCMACGGILIPPSWSRRGAPYPWPERPDNWSWSPPKDAKPAPVTAKRTSPKFRSGETAAKTKEPKAPTAPLSERPCPGCRVPFTPRSPGHGGAPQRYCTASCRQRAKRAEAAGDPLPERACQQCGATFRPKPSHQNGGAQRYCADACRLRAKRAKARLAHTTTGALRACELCGEAFRIRTEHLSQRFCSVAHAMQSMKRLDPVTCKACGVEFQPRKSGRQYCSVPCVRGKARRAS